MPSSEATTAAGPLPLKLAIYNQVSYHLHVVAGAMRVLQALTSAPVTVFLTSKVIQQNWYGFVDWLGREEGFVWKELQEYDGEAYEYACNCSQHTVA
jgi:hypothetical protein